MEYTIIGSKSNVYTITYDVDKEYYNCSCPDFVYRCSKNNEMCKHISLVKTMDDFNVNHAEYTKRGITKKTLSPVELADKRINDDTDSDSDVLVRINLEINSPDKKTKTKTKTTNPTVDRMSIDSEGIRRRRTTITQQLSISMCE